MLDFLNLKPEIFGLDISDLSLKIIKLKKRGRFLDLASFEEASLGPGLIKRGQIKNKDKLAEIIKETVKKVRGEKLKTKYVIASLPEEESFMQVIQMPKINEEDLRSAVIYEAENYIPLSIEEVYLDYQVVSPLYNHLDHLDVLIAAIPKKVVDPYFSVLKKAGLQPLALEIESLAIARALIKEETSPAPLLLLDLGASKTGFIIFSGHSLRFTTSIPVSSGGFTEIIAKNLGIELAEAEKMKVKYGLEERVKIKIKKENFEKTAEKGKIFESLVPALIDLVQQIKKHLDYYQTHSGHEHLLKENKKVSSVLLCGGGANLKGLPELLSLELKLPVELATPWINILPQGKRETKRIPPAKSLEYTAALGLALRGIRERNASWNI